MTRWEQLAMCTMYVDVWTHAIPTASKRTHFDLIIEANIFGMLEARAHRKHQNPNWSLHLNSQCSNGKKQTINNSDNGDKEIRDFQDRWGWERIKGTKGVPCEHEGKCCVHFIEKCFAVSPCSVFGAIFCSRKWKKVCSLFAPIRKTFNFVIKKIHSRWHVQTRSHTHARKLIQHRKRRKLWM